MKRFLTILLCALMLTALCGFTTACTDKTNKNDKDVGSEWDGEHWTDNY